MSTHVLRLPLPQRPVGLLGRIWRHEYGAPARPTGRPGRLRLETLTDDARRDLGLPRDADRGSATTRLGLIVIAGRIL
jgi:hypothetical protein